VLAAREHVAVMICICRDTITVRLHANAGPDAAPAIEQSVNAGSPAVTILSFDYEMTFDCHWMLR
tara:strand:- start:2274 stop:2468 length:195 start_codon:yes stop_codon:yes gene_type:complete